MTEHNTPLSMKPLNVYAEGEVCSSEAEQVITHLTNGSVGVQYDGPGSLEDSQLVESQEAVKVLNTALEYPTQMTPKEQRESERAMEELGFDNSTYGAGSVVQELVEGHGEQGTETPVYLMADFNEDVEKRGDVLGSSYAVIVDNLQTAAESTEEDFEASLTFTGNMAGRPTNQEDIQEFARTIGGDLGDTYQVVADL